MTMSAVSYTGRCTRSVGTCTAVAAPSNDRIQPSQHPTATASRDAFGTVGTFEISGKSPVDQRMGGAHIPASVSVGERRSVCTTHWQYPPKTADHTRAAEEYVGYRFMPNPLASTWCCPQQRLSDCLFHRSSTS
jgi:hypothetical protein